MAAPLLPAGLLEDADWATLLECLPKSDMLQTVAHADAAGLRALMDQQFCMQIFKFLEQLKQAEIYTPRWLTLQLDLGDAIHAPLPGIATPPRYARASKVWGKYIHPHAEAIQRRDPAIFALWQTSIPFLRDPAFAFTAEDKAYLERVYRLAQRDPQAARELEYYEPHAARADPTHALLMPEEPTRSQIPEEELAGFPQTLLECWEDAQCIAGLVDTIWMELNNLELFYQTLVSVRDETLLHMQQEIKEAFAECKQVLSQPRAAGPDAAAAAAPSPAAGAGGGALGLFQPVFPILVRRVQAFRAKHVHETDVQVFKRLIQIAFQQNGTLLETFLPTLMSHIPDAMLSHLQTTCRTQFGLDVSREMCTEKLQTMIRTLRESSLPLEDSVRQLATQLREQKLAHDARRNAANATSPASSH